MSATTITKRTAENLLCDIDCSLMLGNGETIAAVQTPLVQEPPTDGANLTFGSAQIVNTATTYPDGYTARAGTVIKVLIDGGSVPTSQAQGSYIVRVRFTTSNPGEIREATVRLLVIDTP